VVKNFQKKNFKKTFCLSLFAALFFITTISSSISYADSDHDYGIGRIRSCNADGAPSGLEYDVIKGGKDVKFALDNPICITVIATSYALVKIGIAQMNGVCGTGSSVPRITPSPLLDAKDIVSATIKAATNAACAASEVGAMAAYTAAMTQMKIIYDIANATYNNTSVCGSNWTKSDTINYNRALPYYKQELQLKIDAYSRNGSPLLSLTSGDKVFREWYYGGVEVEDNPIDDEVCRDVTQPNSPPQKYYLKGTEAGNYNCDKYNLASGQNDPLTNAPITSQNRLNDFKKAYDCCKKRSQQFICIDTGDEKRFCKGGSRCTMNVKGAAFPITFSAEMRDDDRLICAETYSLCPYNFSIGGGTDYCDYYRDGKWTEGDDGAPSSGYWTMISQEKTASTTDALGAKVAANCGTDSEIRNADCTFNSKAGKCKNYCQYLSHCTKAAGSSYIYNSSISSPYFSAACINFVGDSKNQTGFNGGFILGNQRHFSAPIAQCMKETLENVFYDRAGHSDCAEYGELPSADGSCPSGRYQTDGTFVHKLGNPVKSQSFFTKLQDTLQFAVKLVLTLSVMLYGMKILVGKDGTGAIKKKDLMIYILKIGLVLYFATGDAWQSKFFGGVYGASAEFSRMVFKIPVGINETQRDGCQFGDLTTPDGVTTLATGTNRYPAGKEYLAMWDTLDCKIMRYLGFGPQVSTANIASLIFAGYFTGAIGIYFAMMVMFFGFFFIVATIRALHVFLCSSISIIIFIFVSPIIIPCVLFEKTQDIFKQWLTNLIAFCLQPMILFAYIAFFITVLDKSLIGSASFHGAPPYKTITCEKICKDSNGEVVPYDASTNVAPPCDQPGQVEIDPMNDSVACLININSFGKFPGLEILGLEIPILINIFSSHVKERILTLTRGALIMYLLCSFMDEIPNITKTLIGGSMVEQPKISAGELMSKSINMARALQKRAVGGGIKLGKKGANSAKEAARKALTKSGGGSGSNTGGSRGDHGGSSSKGGDSAGKSSSGGGDSGGGSSSGGGDSGGGSSSGGGDSGDGS
jgi:hypothetical protein